MVVLLIQCPACVYLEDILVFVCPLVYFYFIVLVCFDVLHAYVQVCAAAEDHCLVLSLGMPSVWLSSLLALSLRCLGHLTSCHLAWMIDTVACGLSSSSCASTLWVDRHSEPWAGLPHHWVISPWLDRHSVPWSCLPPSWVDVIVLMAVFVG